MTILNADQICDLAYKSGFRDESLKIAIAIALAESGGNTQAQGKNGPTDGCPNGSIDRGLWQINNCYHPDVSDGCANTPQCNADAAYKISSNGSNWHPWSTFLNGAYLQHMDVASKAVANYKPQQASTDISDQQAADDVTALHRRLADVEAYVNQHLKGNKKKNGGLPQHYHVVNGDTLWGIAVRFYGDGNRYMDIYNANKTTIGPKPDVLTPDMVLVIP